jgi:hypothetical protein
MSYKGDVVLRGEVPGEALVKVADLAAGLYLLKVNSEMNSNKMKLMIYE